MAANRSPITTAKSPEVRILDVEDLGTGVNGKADLPEEFLLATCRDMQQGQWHALKRRHYKGKKLSSKYKGVSWHKQPKAYRSRITYCNKVIMLYYGSDEKAAALAYDEAAKKLFQEHALTNQMMFPEDFK